MASTHVPIPMTRDFMTSFFNTLTTTPIHSQQQPQSSSSTNTNPDHPTNPLKNLPASHRALLATLHVLFPPPMLLQALDLLDRGLVTRLVLADPHAQLSPSSLPVVAGEEGTAKAEREDFVEMQQHAPSPPPLPSPAPPPQLSKDNKAKAQHEEIRNFPRENKRISLYQVRSAQAPKSRFRDATTSTSSSSSTIYTVHLTAWNCSCAAFAFAAFPGGSSSSSSSCTSRNPWDLSETSEHHDDEDDVMLITERRDEVLGEKETRGWMFGGLSRDAAPVCKHLLACLLGERWEEVLGGYVKERVVGREEMAGVGGEG